MGKKKNRPVTSENFYNAMSNFFNNQMDVSKLNDPLLSGLIESDKKILAKIMEARHKLSENPQLLTDQYLLEIIQLSTTHGALAIDIFELIIANVCNDKILTKREYKAALFADGKIKNLYDWILNGQIYSDKEV